MKDAVDVVFVVAVALAALTASGHAVIYKRDSRSAAIWVLVIWILAARGTHAPRHGAPSHRSAVSAERAGHALHAARAARRPGGRAAFAAGQRDRAAGRRRQRLLRHAASDQWGADLGRHVVLHLRRG